MALHPDFKVLDEPAASLDVSIQAQVIALVQGLQRDMGLTYLPISHDLGLVRNFCNRIVVMYLAAVVKALPSPTDTARHPDTAALLASNFTPDPMKRCKLFGLSGEIPSAFALPPSCTLPAVAGRGEWRAIRSSADDEP